MAARNYSTNQWKGYLFVILAAAMWGTNGVAVKYLFNHGISPAMLIQIRSGLAFLILFTILALFKKQLIRFTKKDLAFMVTFAICGMTMVSFMFFYTISKTNVATAVLLQYAGIILITVFAVSFQGERLTWVKITSLALAFWGCFFLVGGYNPKLLRLNTMGLICGLITALFFAFYTLYGEWGLKRYSPWTMVVYAFGLSALFWALFVTPWDGVALSSLRGHRGDRYPLWALLPGSNIYQGNSGKHHQHPGAHCCRSGLLLSPRRTPVISPNHRGNFGHRGHYPVASREGISKVFGFCIGSPIPPLGTYKIKETNQREYRENGKTED
jgi:drug/metabolite transporter (DMT)-like permease